MPLNSPKGEYSSAEELSMETRKVLKYDHYLRPSISRALREIMQDVSRVTLTAEKGVAMLILEKEDSEKFKTYCLKETNTDH